MKRHKTHAEFKRRIFEQQFKLPENFENRVSLLEDELENKNLTESGLKDLIDLYSVSIR